MTEPLYRGEAVCKRWGDSSSAGRTVTLQLEDGGEHPFRGYEGERFAIVVVPIGNDEKPMKKNCSGREIGRQNLRQAGLATSLEVSQGPSRDAPSVIVDAAATKPVPVAQRIEQGDSTSKVAGSNPAGDAKPKKRWHEMPPSQRAALLVKDAEFLRFAAEHKHFHDLECSSADDWLKWECAVGQRRMESKAELDVNPAMANRFRAIEANFMTYRQARQHGAA